MIKVILTFTFFLVSWVPLIRASESPPTPGNRDYLFFGLQSSIPVGESTRFFSSGYRHPSIAYMHVFNDEWLMGLGINFKILYRADTKEDIAIASLSHEIARRVRLSYPTFIDIGSQIMYLLPAEVAAFPLRRSADFHQEIGAGLFSEITHQVSTNSLIGLRIGRWRGTGSKQLQCLESTAIVGWTLD